MTLHELRRNYVYGELTRKDLASDPIVQFRRWFEELRNADLPEWFESNAMVLSTEDEGRRVCSRIVLLKSISEQGFTFFSNYRSAKAKQLENNPRAALNFFWPMFDRQVRVEGVVSRVAPEISDEYFAARPVRSRLGAIASPQSQVIDDDAPLELAVEKLAAQYHPDNNIPRPDHWGGYQLVPDLVEFWQGKPSRLHDRFQYRSADDGWKIQRLAP
jgi:pyridoxamine 5'-phosphate oxidase